MSIKDRSEDWKAEDRRKYWDAIYALRDLAKIYGKEEVAAEVEYDL